MRYKSWNFSNGSASFKTTMMLLKCIVRCVPYCSRNNLTVNSHFTSCQCGVYINTRVCFFCHWNKTILFLTMTGTPGAGFSCAFLIPTSSTGILHLRTCSLSSRVESQSTWRSVYIIQSSPWPATRMGHKI